MPSSNLSLGARASMALMTYDLKNVLAVNLEHLMERSADLKSQAALGRRAKVAQTTVGNYLHPESYVGYPTMKNIDKLAKAFGLNAWHLLHPRLGTGCLSETEFKLFQKIRGAFSSSS